MFAAPGLPGSLSALVGAVVPVLSPDSMVAIDGKTHHPQIRLAHCSSILALAFALLLPSAHAADAAQMLQNKQTVVTFYNKTLNEKDAEGAIALMGARYTRHNAHVADGKDGFRQLWSLFLALAYETNSFH